MVKMEESIEGFKLRCSNCYINAGYLTSLSIQIPYEGKVIFSPVQTESDWLQDQEKTRGWSECRKDAFVPET